MKKLAMIVASLALLATPAFACPHSDKAEKTEDAAPKTAEKAKTKEAPKPATTDKAKTAKPAEKPATKTAEKVSQK